MIVRNRCLLRQLRHVKEGRGSICEIGIGRSYQILLMMGQSDFDRLAFLVQIYISSAGGRKLRISMVGRY